MEKIKMNEKYFEISGNEITNVIALDITKQTNGINAITVQNVATDSIFNTYPELLFKTKEDAKAFINKRLEDHHNKRKNEIKTMKELLIFNLNHDTQGHGTEANRRIVIERALEFGFDLKSPF